MKLFQLMIAIFFLAFASCSKHWSDPPLNETDRSFLNEAAFHNLNEIEAGALAHTKASDSYVIEFGDRMEQDHRIAQNELRTLAESNHMDLYYGFAESDETMKQQLIQLKGQSFDSTFIHSHIIYHKKVMDLFTNEIENGKDEGLKNYASKYLAHLKLHYQRADSIAQRF